MATFEQENGSIKLSSKEYKNFKKQLIEDNNYWLERCQYVAERCFSHLQENIDEYKERSKSLFVKDKLAFDDNGSLVQLTPNEDKSEQSNKFMNFIISEIVKHAMYTNNYGAIVARNHKVDILEEGGSFVKNTLLKKNENNNLYIKKPEKSDFPFATLSDKKIEFQYGTIEFNDSNKTVSWNIPSADAAVKKAWQSRVGISFTNAINSISEWKESTGGVFYYKNDTDETFRLSKSLGPIGQEEFKNRIQNMKNKMKLK